MKTATRIAIFLVINFAALAIGGFFTGGGVTGDWYANLNKAPWTPPGWMFGAAWTLIMVCFSIYMGVLVSRKEEKSNIYLLYAVHLVLNIAWNPLFFYFHDPVVSLVSIVMLTLLMLYFLIKYFKVLKLYTLLVLPYCIWLCVATSLNLYIVIYN